MWVTKEITFNLWTNFSLFYQQTSLPRFLSHRCLDQSKNSYAGPESSFPLHYFTLHYFTLHYITLTVSGRSRLKDWVNKTSIWNQTQGAMLLKAHYLKELNYLPKLPSTRNKNDYTKLIFTTEEPQTQKN